MSSQANNKLSLTHGWPFPNMKDLPLSFRFRMRLVVPMVGTFSKLFLTWFNSVDGYNVDALRKAISSRPKAVPLITVSNHYSCVDDPMLWGLLRWRDVLNSYRMRWSLAAHDIVFTGHVYSWFFSSGKCVPVIRGKGVYQEGMNFCLDRLSDGAWVHIFPEGKVNTNLERMRLKWGVGRLVYEAQCTPIVLPFYHVGMDAVLPSSPPYIPRVGKEVTVCVGEPLDFRAKVHELRQAGADVATARKIITDAIQTELNSLRDKTEELHQRKKKKSKNVDC